MDEVLFRGHFLPHVLRGHPWIVLHCCSQGLQLYAPMDMFSLAYELHLQVYVSLSVMQMCSVNSSPRAQVMPVDWMQLFLL